MIYRTKAVIALQDGCRRLGLPSSTAAALVQLLSVKRLHDQFVGSSVKHLRMSPGAKIDQLWHFMLLNTAVSTQVHELLGGVVEHRGIDSTDLSDESKLLQRLYALNVLLLGGHTPDVNLWTEPGTAMHTLHLTASPIPALQSLPGGGQLYVTPNLPKQQQAQLVQALQLLYLDDDKSPGDYKVKPEEGVQQAAAPPGQTTRTAAGATDNSAASGEVHLPAKRPCTGQQAGAPSQQQQPQQQQQQAREVQQLQQQGVKASMLPFWLIVENGENIHFKVKSSTLIGNITAAYAARVGIDERAFRLVFDGYSAQPKRTVDYYGLQDGDIMEVFLNQEGC